MSYPIPPGGYSPQNPPPPGYRPPHWQAPQGYRPPGSIKTLGILNLVFAGLGALGLAFTYAMYFTGDGRTFGVRNPVIEIAHASPEFMAFMKYSLILHVIFLVVFAASGIGLVKVTAWGRKLAIVYGLYGIVSTIVGLVVTNHYIMSKLGNDPVGNAGSMGGYMSIIGVAYPLVLLIFMFKRNVREHFAREPQVPTARVV